MKRFMKRRVVLLAAAAVGAVVIGGTALAGPAGAVKTFTGCLASNDGVITKVKEGANPKSACTSGQTLVRISGGDITKISVTGALTLPNEGESGDVTIGLDPKYSLPQSCANAQVAKWNNSTSAWVCAADNNTTYSASTGLDLTGTTFSVDEDYRVKNTPDCDSGKFATGFDDGGEIQCAAPSQSSGIEVWQKKLGSSTALPKGEGVDVVIMPLPPGTYLVTAVATIRDGGGDFRDEQVSVECGLRNGVFAALPVEVSQVDIGEELGHDGPSGNAVVHGVITFAGEDSVRFTCTSSEGDDEPDQAYTATVTATKVGSFHTPS